MKLTPEQKKALALAKKGYGAPRISRHVSVTESSVTRWLRKFRTAGLLHPRAAGANDCDPVVDLEEQKKDAPPPPDPIIPHDIDPKDVGMLDPDKASNEELREMLARREAELEILREQLIWASHADIGAGASGGTMTINLSDWHLHDRNHLPGVLESCEQKTLKVIDKFKPRRLRVLENGDIIPGRGIYREQVLEAVLPKSDQQISAAGIRFLEFIEGVADAGGFDPGDIEIRKTPGNHDYSMGDPTAMPFVFILRMLGLNASFCSKYTVWNLADKGIYNLLAFHGYGHSRHSPSSPALIDESIKLVLKLATTKGMVGKRRIRRVTHGHTHWMSLGQERAADLTFDVTGGFQKYERVKQGYNERPTGWLVYHSPGGSGDIIPIPVHPELSSIERDMTDPNLQPRNMVEAARCLKKFETEAQKRGVAKDFWKEIRDAKEED